MQICLPIVLAEEAGSNRPEGYQSQLAVHALTSLCLLCGSSGEHPYVLHGPTGPALALSAESGRSLRSHHLRYGHYVPGAFLGGLPQENCSPAG
jgi:hypothetical protein